MNSKCIIDQNVRLENGKHQEETYEKISMILY
jgi:hypothetical protein